MVSKISGEITAGQRQQLQRFLDRYGEQKQSSNFNVKSDSTYATNGLTNLSEVLNTYSVNSQNSSFSLANIENTAYGKHLDAIFNPAPLVDSEVDGVKVKVAAEEWEKDVEVKLSDLAERMMKLGINVEGSDDT
ncbi:hypothetical protein [Curvivirga aplysinae]|uniref:hypothetical protein n=1 Tax=Curvivirga aplysinae TaxID=2529852 RepID=UPI0012BD8003|nr:hypothetical protein [Curvivirga aplysinae]MTI09793.1 hypothetical protein [Curvivirga aplysinae]